MKHDLTIGDKVRVRYGDREGEVATVGDITWHSNQFGAYARVLVIFGDGQTSARGMDSLEKVQDHAAGSAPAG